MIPKPTSTIIAVYLQDVCILKETIIHHSTPNDRIEDQVELRKKAITQLLIDVGINLSKLDAITTTGGLIRAVEGGTYIVNEQMYADLKNNYNGKHISNLGGLIAYSIAADLNLHAFIVDPPVVDELENMARISGAPFVERKSVFHALNHKAVARLAAEELSVRYEKANFIVAHLGNGITIGAHQEGKVVDVNNGLHGEGPFSLERAGSIPTEDVLHVAFSKECDEASFIHQVTFESGLKGYLRIDSLDQLLSAIEKQEAQTLFYVEAMAYQIAKEIGAMSTVLRGKVDGIVLTGQLSHVNELVASISKNVQWIADIHVFPGEYDLVALQSGTLRVLQGLEQPKRYFE